MKNRFVSIAILLSLIALSACNTGKDSEKEPSVIRSSREGIVAVNLLSKIQITSNILMGRPSAQLGIFTSSFLAQKGVFLSVASAKNAILHHVKLINNKPSSNETFQLLIDIANILQVDIVDVLNRSPDRSKALNQYTETLKNTGKVAERKFIELEEEETLKREEQKEKRANVTRIEREIREAYRNEEYGDAASRQKELTEAESELAKVKNELDITSDLIKRFEDMLEIASKRLIAIEKNREILIAGLRVTDVPGIKNLDILEKGKRYKRKTSDEGGLFGIEHLE